MRARIAVIILVATTLAAHAQLARTELPAELRSQMDKAATEVLASTGVPSASIAVVKDGRIVAVGDVGAANVS